MVEDTAVGERPLSCREREVRLSICQVISSGTRRRGALFRLRRSPVVALVGPRPCGNATLAKKVLSRRPRSLYVDLERPSDAAKLTDPEAFHHPGLLLGPCRVVRITVARGSVHESPDTGIATRSFRCTTYRYSSPMPRHVPTDSTSGAPPTDLETRALAAVMGSRPIGELFMAALRRANQLFGAALLLQVAELRRAGDPVERALARTKEIELQLAFAFQTIDILLERLSRVPPAHRPRYRKADRGRILHHKEVFHLSCREIARLYALTRSTVHRWVVDCMAPKRPDRPLVAPAPPDRSYSALVRQQVLNLSMAGFGGSLRIAQTLAREGLLLSRSTVRRWTKESSPGDGGPLPKTLATSNGAGGDARPSRSTVVARHAVEQAVRARCPNHVLMVDVTLVRALMGFLRFRVAVVLDVFSRFPLAWRLFADEPSAEEMVSVLDDAVARARRLHPDLAPSHFVTDKGACFTAETFQAAVARHGMKARFGAVGRHGSIALIERLWLGLKDLLHLRLDRCLLRDDLENRIVLGLFYYSVLKPHQGLGGATPAEIYFRKVPARVHALQPPREGTLIPPPAFNVRYLDAARRLPVLFRKAA